MMRSMDHRRDKNAPRQLPGKEKSEFNQSPEIRKLDMRIEEATRDIAGSPAEHPARFKERQKLYNEKRALLRSAETAYRKKWFSASYDSEALRQLQPDDENEKSLAPPQPTNAFHMIRHLMPARDRIANAMLLTQELRSEEGQATLRDIYSLCIDDNRVAYRPDERPIDGVCPCKGCLKIMIE